MKITADYVRDQVAEIRSHSNDPEAAHSVEDSLHYDVLSAIATGQLKGKKARQCAALAIATEGIDFPRWCA